MKKCSFYLCLIALIAMSFSNCQKETVLNSGVEAHSESESFDYAYSNVNDYEMYIDQLQLKTGIDINEFSSDIGVQKMSKALISFWVL